MERIDIRDKAEIIFNFKWSSSIGKHEEKYFSKFNFWRDLDLLPEKVKGHLIESAEEKKITIPFKKGEIFPYFEENIIEIGRSQFSPQKPYKTFMPLIGRFYPLGFFKGLKGVFSGNVKPVRVIGIDDSKSKLTIDTNVPIAKYDIELEILVEKIITKPGDIGGECKNWLELSLENGPGMQVRYNGVNTDFEFENPESLKREDETEDMIFYKEPRITTHIDAKCHENLVNLYSRILPKKGNILDLMSSVQSHLPYDVEYYTVGLGLNEEEMRQNRSLKEYVIHDINKNPKLPFHNEEFEIVVCDLSIDYITKPFEVIKEIRRILKPDGIVTFSFSNRYFSPKVIKLWIDLHDFERMGYVLEILLRDGGFKDFHTYSYRGYNRPYGDKYFGSTSFSDPLYVVYAKKA